MKYKVAICDDDAAQREYLAEIVGTWAVQIVFITGFYEYFSEGFDVSALHYLIKPVGPEKPCPDEYGGRQEKEKFYDY